MALLRMKTAPEKEGRGGAGTHCRSVNVCLMESSTLIILCFLRPSDQGISSKTPSEPPAPLPSASPSPLHHESPMWDGGSRVVKCYKESETCHNATRKEIFDVPHPGPGRAESGMNYGCRLDFGSFVCFWLFLFSSWPWLPSKPLRHCEWLAAQDLRPANEKANICHGDHGL